MHYTAWVSSLPDDKGHKQTKQTSMVSTTNGKINSKDFSDIIWTDECTERKQNTYRKVGQPCKLKSKPKHPLKLHVWGGISMKRATPLVMFKENLTAVHFGKVLEKGLILFVRSKFADHHKFQQDNDPKHRSNYIKQFLKDNRIEW